MSQLSQPVSPRRNTNLRARSWDFTFNNYTEQDLSHCLKHFCNDLYVIGEEVGKEGTKHLQGHVEFKNQMRFDTLKKEFPQVHWEVSKNKFAGRKYCAKGDKIHTNIAEEKEEETLEQQYDKFMELEYGNVIWKPWQQAVLDILAGPVDRRKVHWFYEREGNKGKSFLAKFIEWKHPTVIVNGKQGDVFHGIKNFIETKKKYPNPVLIDIPRTNENYVCYGTMEKIKDGLFYSGKYEGGVIRLLPCHLFVFANFPPDTSKMSSDRWDIHMVEE